MRRWWRSRRTPEVEPCFRPSNCRWLPVKPAPSPPLRRRGESSDLCYRDIRAAHATCGGGAATVGARGTLAQCAGGDPDGAERVAHLQRLADLRIPLSLVDHAGRLAGRSAAMALRGHVAARGERAGLPAAEHRDRASAASFLAVVATPSHLRFHGGAARTAGPRRSGPLQRGAKGGLPGGDRAAGAAGAVRTGDLEVGAVSDIARAD